MKAVMIALPLILVSCSKDKDEKKTFSDPSPKPTPLTLLDGMTEVSLWDYSSESRCDGIKEYLTKFAAQRLEKADLKRFSCAEVLPASEQFVSTAELAFDNESGLIAISVGRDTTHISFCSGAYNPDPTHMNCPVNPSGPVGKNQTSLRTDLPSYFSTFARTPQTKELIYGINAQDFYTSAESVLGSLNGVTVPFDGQTYQFYLTLSPSIESPLDGQVKILKIEPGTGYQIFGCADNNCMVAKTFDYQIRQHWFIFTADRKMSAFPIPNPQ